MGAVLWLVACSGSPTTQDGKDAKDAEKAATSKPAAKPVAHAQAKPAATKVATAPARTATAKPRGRMVTARLANGKTVTYDCSLAGNKTKQACKG